MKTGLMVRFIPLAIGCSLAAISSTVSAEDFWSEPAEWQSLENQMMLEDYNHQSEANRKMLQSSLRSTARQTFNSLGVSDQALRYVGGAIGLATQDTRIHLNDSKTLSLDLMDVSDSDRAVFFGYRTSW